jgi:hypothetical protein
MELKPVCLKEKRCNALDSLLFFSVGETLESAPGAQMLGLFEISSDEQT